MKKQINPNIKVSAKDQNPNIKVLYKGQTPNILLIIADDLGQDVVKIRTKITDSGTRAMRVYTNDGAVDIYGDLPNTSRLLRNGLYFSQAWAQPACSPTRASIFTGLHPWQNGVGSPLGELETKKFTTLPNLLAASGYVSGLFGKWHLGMTDGYLPKDHGWAKHVGTLDNLTEEPGPYSGYGDWNMVDSDKSFVTNMTDTRPW